MIIEGLEKYDVGNTARHEENKRKLDRLEWSILATLATVAGALALEIVRFALGK
jgi:hypothetical protein